MEHSNHQTHIDAGNTYRLTPAGEIYLEIISLKRWVQIQSIFIGVNAIALIGLLFWLISTK